MGHGNGTAPMTHEAAGQQRPHMSDDSAALPMGPRESLSGFRATLPEGRTPTPQRVAKLYRQVGSIRAVSRETGLSPYRVRKKLDAAGVAVAAKPRWGARRAKEREAQRLAAEGMTVGGIAKKVGMSWRAVLAALEEA